MDTVWLISAAGNQVVVKSHSFDDALEKALDALYAIHGLDANISDIELAEPISS